ncbi:hypothetical protein GKZ89_06090 [Bacillus mangrovi]|uniref:SPOR domain-containing protein n=1 Tax=Metabacillus mangrovi TaxID=1491830 RepID=A0A7X2S496_9BACI|nr:hypothetical protein [Metabacillus mangrovi]MTH52975.1 hypothetical protein [Metabacillus mangrovi]
MDKQNKKASIRVVLKGENAEKETLIPITSWKDRAARETAASAEKDEFDWILPDEEEDIYKEDPKVQIGKKEKRKGASLNFESKNDRLFPVKQFLTTALIAVVLGVAFGFIALNVISDQEMPAAVQPQAASPAAAEPAAEPAQQPAKSASNGRLATFVVQNGKFSSKGAAESLAEEMKGKGFAAAVVESDGAFFVYGGVGFLKEETAALGQTYQKQQVEAWGGKQAEWLVPESSSSGKLQEAAETILSASLKQIAGSKADESAIQAASGLAAGVKEDSAFKKSLTEAAKQLLNDSSASAGWKAQQLILDGLAAK